ncbi:hypothetical protein ACFV0C_36445 [Streptomyces sp. NPDC059568]|uniref:hypothetical protein n=1 Tax=Streptomyces sp. NPDC059568 TaxID=3346868 RepID=UPI00368B8626
MAPDRAHHRDATVLPSALRELDVVPGQRLAAQGMTRGKAQHLDPVTGTFSCDKACAVAASGTARFW